MKPEGSLPHSQVPETASILRQLDPVHTPTSYFLKTHLNIILSSMSGSPKWSLSLSFFHQNPVNASPLLHSAACPTHLILLDFITLTIVGEGFRSFRYSLCSSTNRQLRKISLGRLVNMFSTGQLLT